MTVLYDKVLGDGIFWTTV